MPNAGIELSLNCKTVTICTKWEMGSLAPRVIPFFSPDYDFPPIRISTITIIFGLRILPRDETIHSQMTEIQVFFYFKLILTTLPKSHSLGLPLDRSQTLQSEVPGPHPDGHGHPETT